MIADHADNAGFRLSANTAAAGLINQYFYTSSGNVYRFDEAEIFADIQELEGADIELEFGVPVRGSVSRPPAADSTNPITVRVSAFGFNSITEELNTSFSLATVNVEIPAGQTTADFELILEAGVGEDIALGYSCFDCPGVLSVGYVGPAGTVFAADQAQLFSPNFAVGNQIDIHLLEPDVVGGTLRRPAGTEGTELEATVSVYQSTEGLQQDVLVFTSTVVIAADQNDAPFELGLPDEPSFRFRLAYSCFACDSVVSNGYYADERTVFTRGAATELASSDFANPIIFQLAAAQRIAGQISRLPSDAGLEQIGADIRVVAATEFFPGAMVSQSVWLPIAQNQDSFELFVAPTNQYQLSYRCSSNCGPYAPMGYYSEAGTTSSINSATVLSDADDLDLIDFEFLAPNEETLTITRPDGADINRPLFLTVYARTYEQGQTFSSLQSVDVEIAAGETSAEFSVTNPPESEHELFYECRVSCPGVTERAYFTEAGLVLYELNAERVQATNLNGLILDPVATNTVSGQLVRPAGVDVNKEFVLKVSVVIFEGLMDTSTLFDDFSSQFVVLPAGVTMADFNFEVPGSALATYQLDYECRGACAGIVPEGFYAETGTQADRSGATSLSNGSALNALQFELLPALTFTGSLNFPAGISYQRFQTATITVDSAAGQVRRSVTFPIEISSGAFMLELPVSNPDQYQITLDCFSCDGIASPAYLEVDGALGYDRSAVTSLSSADLSSDQNIVFDPGTNLVVELLAPSGVNLDMQNQATLTTEILDSDGVVIESYAVDSVFGPSIYFLPDGTQLTATIFSQGIPFFPDAAIRLKYECIGCPDVIETGYYSSTGSIRLEDATLLDFSTDQFLIASLQRISDLDGDLDGIVDASDNCPFTPNLTQADLDGDGVGDLCDNDTDGDQVLNVVDLNPGNSLICGDSDADLCDDCASASFNPADDGDDIDGDGLCDIGDPNDDGDNFLDVDDNCPLTPNNDQADLDDDGEGDACDPDIDGDLVHNFGDSEPENRLLCSDIDGDLCDDCASGGFDPLNDGIDSDEDGICNVGDSDDDNDMVLDDLDNCPLIANEDQNPNACTEEEICIPIISRLGRTAIICL